MSKIIFFCRDTRENIEIFEYYKQDILALEELGHDVVICTKYSEIPLKFDAIFIWWWTYAIYPVLLAKLFRKPAIITGAFNLRFPKNFNGVDYFKRPLYQRILIRLSIKLADLNLFINTFEERECTEFFKIKTARYFPCTIQDCYFTSSSKKELKLFNIAWTGKDNLKRKGIPQLIEALAILKNENIDIKLYMAGQKGDGYQWLVNRIKELDLENNIEILGPVSKEEKMSYLQKCSIYVQPSFFEGFGLGIAEAMASELCVIVCDVGAVRSVVGDCGVYAEAGSAKDLAKKIKLVYENPSLLKDKQIQGKKRMLDMFKFSEKLKKLEVYLKDLKINC